MKLKVILIFLLANQAFAQKQNYDYLSTKISHVTVFLQGAHITRHGETWLAAGQHTVLVKGLSQYLDAASVQVTANGDFTIHSVNHKYNYLSGPNNQHRSDSLFVAIETIETDIAHVKARLEVLAEQQSLLNANKALADKAGGLSLATLQQAMDFYGQQLTEIKNEEINLKKQLSDKHDLLDKINTQLSELQRHPAEKTSELELIIEAGKAGKGIFDIRYLVQNAGWHPSYDLRVKSIENPLALTYKAEVHQNTGVDWKNVKLSFSNANPSQSGLAPELKPWRLNFPRFTKFKNPGSNTIGSVQGIVTDEENQPLPGANVLIQGTTVGTVSDTEGHYRLTLPNGAEKLVCSFVGYQTVTRNITGAQINIRMNPDRQQLNEIVIRGYASSARTRTVHKQETKPAKTPVITTVENQTTVEFETAKPYTLLSNNKQLTVTLKNLQIPALYQYFAIPKLDKDAFLMAQITNWDQYHLMEGEANLYFENAFVGRTVLNTNILTDTLDISLGRDKNIVLRRTKEDTYDKKQSISLKQTSTRNFIILAKNKKSQPIHLTIFDQLPVSVNSDIEVATKELSGGALDEHSGRVTWHVDLPAQQQTSLKLTYEVRYPKRERLILE